MAYPSQPKAFLAVFMKLGLNLGPVHRNNLLEKGLEVVCRRETLFLVAVEILVRVLQLTGPDM